MNCPIIQFSDVLGGFRSYIEPIPTSRQSLQLVALSLVLFSTHDSRTEFCGFIKTYIGRKFFATTYIKFRTKYIELLMAFSVAV
jgi:hypothetical protein